MDKMKCDENHLMNPMTQAIESALFFEMPPVQTEVGLVLGSAWGNAILAAHAATLYHQGAFSHLIVSGGSVARRENMAKKEFQVLAMTLTKHGVPATVIVTESMATNTGQNIEFSLDKGLGGAASVTVVCRRQHQRRVLMTMRKYLPDTPTTTATLVTGSDGKLLHTPWYSDCMASAFAQSEYAKVVQPETNGLPFYVNQGFCVTVDIERERKRAQALPPIPPVYLQHIL